MTWPTARLGTLGEFRNGLNYSKANFGTGLQVISVKDFGDRSIPDLAVVHEINPAGLSLEKALLKRNDILFVRSNGNRDLVGRSLRIDRDYENLAYSAFCIRFRATRPEVDPEFLSYFFKTQTFREALSSLGKGTNINNLNQEIMQALVVPVLPRPLQQRIVDILSAYDDLLEINRRRMALLEEGALQLFREWFVRLQFPGREHTRVNDGVPERFERIPTPEAIELNPATRLTDEAEHWSVDMADLLANSMVIQSARKREGRSGSKFRNGDTLFARITPCLENGKTAFVDFLEEGESARGSTEFIVLRSKRVTPEYVYCLARTYDFRENAIKSMVGSSGRQRVQESCFAKFLVMIPPTTLMELFTDHVRSMFQLVKTLHAQNQKLRTVRDLLLPRLMSGELAV